MDIYVVQTGDTLWKIAQQFQTDIEQIALANQLEMIDQLVVGQAIIIPDPLSEYVIQPGDQLWTIAERFGITLEELAQFNGISSLNSLFVGEVLEIPYILHLVQPGDTLWQLSETYGVSVNELARLNQIAYPFHIYVNQVIRIPHRKKKSIDVNAYITQLGESGYQEVMQLGRYFTYLSPFSYSIREDGSLTSMQEEQVLNAAQETRVMPLLTLTNFKEGNFSSDLAANILRNYERQETLIEHILSLMREKGYQGVNVDFEYVYPEDRKNYNHFLQQLVDQLHPEGYIVSTAVAPKESTEQPGLLYEAHDYEAHGKIVDFVIIMTYEWGWAGGPPLAIAPIHKVRDVLDYAVTVIPREKIMMGIPLYGRDWKVPWQEGTIARTISPKEAVQLAINHQEAILYDEISQSPFIRYTDENHQQHEVWFEDARSMQAKLSVIEEYGLKGASYWVLGNPFPQNWPLLQENFTVRKS